MKVGDIKRRVRDSAGDTAVLQFTDATLNDWLNDGIRECVIENSLLQNIANSTTVIDQGDYGLPANIFKIHSVRVNKLKLRMLTLEEWEEVNANEVNADPASGQPTMAYIYAGTLNLYPVPSEEVDLQIFYTKMPPTISYGSGGNAWEDLSIAIPEEFHSRLVTYCLAQVALQDDDYNKYAALMGEFKTGVIDLKHVKDQQEDLYPFISVATRDEGDDITLERLY
jgi:hypothetical protein